MKAINVIGQAGSGKSTVANYLHESYGAAIHRPSDIIRAYAAKHDLPLKGRADYADYHRRLIAEDPEAMLRPVLQSDAELVCIDGLRVWAHAQTLRAKVGMRTLALACPPEVCFERIKTAPEWRRYRDESQINSLQDYLADIAVDSNNANPLEPNVEWVMAMANETIAVGPDTSPDEILRQHVDPFMAKLLGKE